MKIIERNDDEITLQQRGRADLNIGIDECYNYWLYSEMGDVDYKISEINLNERSEYDSFHNLMISLVGRYFMYEDDGREFWDKENKTITIKSDPINYLGHTYEGATLKLQLLEGFILVKLNAKETIDGKTVFKINPNRKNKSVFLSINDCFHSLKNHAIKERPEVKEREKGY